MIAAAATVSAVAIGVGAWQLFGPDLRWRIRRRRRGGYLPK